MTERNNHGQIEKLYVCELIWPGPHTPVERWVLCREYTPAIDENQVQKEMEILLADEKYFGNCDCCGKKMIQGNMCDAICHACMEKHDVIF
jgi:hypothetical protein